MKTPIQNIITSYRKFRVGHVVLGQPEYICVSDRERAVAAKRGEEVFAKVHYYNRVLTFRWIGPGGMHLDRGWTACAWVLESID